MTRHIYGGMNVLRTATFVAVAAIGAVPTIAGAAWTKSFAVEWHEPAFYYGAKEGISAPGTDCPKGTNHEMDWRKELKTSWRTDADVDLILNPENPLRPRVGGLRGPNKENVYEQPWAVPDPGLVGVSGNMAFGFDLDGNKNNGFKGAQPLNDSQGIDNEYYRAIGCFKAWRGPTREAHHSKYVNDGMRDGRYTLVIVVSGTGTDWQNDDDAKVGFYIAKDKMVKDANGEIARDYSYRINPDKTYQAVVSARVVNGIVESTTPAQVVTRSVDSLPLILKDGRLRFEIGSDGKLYGFIGGYRSIDDYYYEWAGGGAIFELTMHINVPAYWYALQRSADGHFDYTTGRYTTISTAYRFYAVPAFAVTPDGSEAVTTPMIFQGQQERAAAGGFAVASRQPGAARNPPPSADSPVGAGGRFVNYVAPPKTALPRQKKAPPTDYSRNKQASAR